MQEQMLGGKGFLVIGYLLEKVQVLFGFVLSISPVFLVFSVTWHICGIKHFLLQYF